MEPNRKNAHSRESGRVTAAVNLNLAGQSSRNRKIPKTPMPSSQPSLEPVQKKAAPPRKQRHQDRRPTYRRWLQGPGKLEGDDERNRQQQQDQSRQCVRINQRAVHPGLLETWPESPDSPRPCRWWYDDVLVFSSPPACRRKVGPAGHFPVHQHLAALRKFVALLDNRLTRQ
jgi:hypothetical protein